MNLNKAVRIVNIVLILVLFGIFSVLIFSKSLNLTSSVFYDSKLNSKESIGCLIYDKINDLKVDISREDCCKVILSNCNIDDLKKIDDTTFNCENKYYAYYLYLKELKYCFD